MAAATAAAAIQPRPVAVEAAAIAVVAAVAPKAAAAVPVVAVAVPKSNAEPGLVSPSARCTSVVIRDTAAVAARGQADVADPAVQVLAQDVSATRKVRRNSVKRTLQLHEGPSPDHLGVVVLCLAVLILLCLSYPPRFPRAGGE